MSYDMPTYHDREQEVLAKASLFIFRKRTGVGSKAFSERRYPLEAGKTMREQYDDIMKALASEEYRKHGIMVYAVAVINGEERFCALNKRFNPWSV